MAVQGSSQGQLQEFLEIVSRRRWQVILPASFVITIGIVFAALAPRKYEVPTRVEIRETRVDSDEEFKDPQASATTREIDNAESHIRNAVRLRGIIEEHLEMWPRYQTLDPRERVQFIRKKIQKNLAVNVQPRPRNQGSTFVDITYTDVSPSRAEAFLEQIIEAWVQDVIERDRTTIQTEINILQNQVQRAEKEFNDKQEKFFDLTKAMNIDPTQSLGKRVERLTDPIIAELDAIEREIFQIEGQLAQAEGELSDLQASLAETPPDTVLAESLDSLSGGGAVAALEASLFQLREQQAPLRPEHPRWSTLERQIRELEAKIDEARALEAGGRALERRVPNPQYLNLVQLIDEKTAEVTGLRRLYEAKTVQHKSALAKANQRQDDYQELLTLDAARQEAFNDLETKKAALNQKETTMALITNAWDKPSQVVEPPVAGKEPDEPNVLLILTFSVLAGIAAGLGVAMIGEFGRPGCRTAVEVARVIPVPVLGSINRIVTRRERQRMRRRRLAIGATSVLFMVTMLWTAYLWNYDSTRLPAAVVQAIEDFQFQLL